MNLATNRTLYVVARLLQIAVAVVFIIASMLKAFDPQGFSEQIRSYQIFPALSSLAAWSFIIVELMLAAALVLNFMPRFTIWMSIVLLLGFIGVTAYGMVTGMISNCGCFGNLVKRTPSETIIEDTVMIAFLLVSYFILRKRNGSGNKWKLAVIAITGVLGAAVTGTSAQLPVDAFVTELRTGAHFTSWPVENVPFDLNKGKHLVFLFSVKSPSIQKDIEKMNVLSQSDGLPASLGLIIDGSEELTSLVFQYAASFQSGALEPRFAKSLYRKLPRTFILNEGIVTEVWSGIPALEEVRSASTKLPK